MPHHFRPELDLFSCRSHQNDIVKTELIELKPINSLLNASYLEFISFGYFDAYRDCHNAYLKLEVILDDGVADKPYEMNESDPGSSVVNNLFGSLFSQCNVFLNGKPTSTQDTNLPLRQYIESRFNYSEAEVKHKLAGQLWSWDTTGHFDDIKKTNLGFFTRARMISNGKKPFTLIGPVTNDFFAQQRLLIPNVDLRVILSLAKKEFYMLSPDICHCYVKILDASLFIPHVTVSADVLVEHERILHTRNAVYNIKKVEVRKFTVLPNSDSFVLDNLIVNSLPKFIIIALADADSVEGRRDKNPYNFQHYNMNSFNLYINGFQYLPKPLEFNFKKKATETDLTKPNDGIHAFYRMNKELHFDVIDRTSNISAEEFCNGSFFLPFDLTPDKSFNPQLTTGQVNGSLKIECKFNETISKAISVILYAVTDSEIQIDLSRNVYLKE